jgi:SAM-dependent methyltransferase
VDIGTGAGQWVIEVAEEYPDAEVIGTDISPVQPWVDAPENCQFRVESLLDGLCFDTGSLDLVNSRLYPVYRVDFRWLVVAIPADYWHTYLGEIYRVLKPGNGWVQIIDYDYDGTVASMVSGNNSLPSTSALAKVLE